MAKFGGTSLGDAQAMLRSASIALDRGASVVVVSATAGTTDRLVALCSFASSAEAAHCRPILDSLAQSHTAIAHRLEVSETAARYQERLLSELEETVRLSCLPGGYGERIGAKIQGFGENLSANLFCAAVDKIHGSPAAAAVDARSIIKTDSSYHKARVDFAKTGRLAKKFLGSPGRLYVVQGFVGSDPDGDTTLLGRGGSDYTAAIVAEALGAKLQIWTDVAGIKTTDPAICPNAKSIGEMTFQEAAELATFGANILHPATLSPAKRAGIRVFVASSFPSLTANF